MRPVQTRQREIDGDRRTSGTGESERDDKGGSGDDSRLVGRRRRECGSNSSEAWVINGQKVIDAQEWGQETPISILGVLDMPIPYTRGWEPF